MIAVDIFAPYLGETYDFELDENVPLGALTEEIIEMICHKEKIAFPKRGLCKLFDPERKKMFLDSDTLYDTGTHPGQRLILC